MTTKNTAPGLVDMWLSSPGMREPARVARALGYDLEAQLTAVREQVSDEELAEWLRAAVTPRR